jgi:hypothetical protein
MTFPLRTYILKPTPPAALSPTNCHFTPANARPAGHRRQLLEAADSRMISCAEARSPPRVSLNHKETPGRRTKLGHVAVPALLLATILLAAQAADLTLRFGTPFVTNSNLHKAMEKFAEVVAQESGGKIKVQVYADSQIGDIQQPGCCRIVRA